MNPSLDRVSPVNKLCLCDEPLDQVIYRLEFKVRPWTTNAERAGNHWHRASLVKEWRNAFHILAKEQKIPRLKWAAITAQPHLTKKGRNQDVGACNPAVKAAIDGIVDAGVLKDDSPEFVTSISFMAPLREDRNSLVIYIRGVLA